jgi:hypothetical protein
MVVGGFNILAGIITTIQQFLKITQLNEAHRVSSIAWDKFYRNIKIELAKHPIERMDVRQMVKLCKEEFDRLMETSPVIPEKIIAEFKKSFQKSEEYMKISKPEICDFLISTEAFRNPWFNEENREKRSLELVQLNTSDILKKKALEQKNILVIKTFQKTFYNLNHREPMENEIIDNLSENIDPEFIKRILIDIQKEIDVSKV